MPLKVENFILELIEEVLYLQQCIDAEYSTDFERSDNDRESQRITLFAKLEALKNGF